jgi:hypothetical protein
MSLLATDEALHSALRQELENRSRESCRITNGATMIDILKDDLLSPRHTLADAFADQCVEGLRFLPRITRSAG